MLLALARLAAGLAALEPTLAGAVARVSRTEGSEARCPIACTCKNITSQGKAVGTTIGT